MTQEELIELIIQKSKTGELLTRKHDPKKIRTLTYKDYRSVLSFDAAESLYEFLSSSDCYDIKVYDNIKHPHSPLYIEIIPKGNKFFDIPASGITAYSSVATESLDRLVVISGSSQGLHIFGEASANIRRKELAGKLIQRLQ